MFNQNPVTDALCVAAVFVAGYFFGRFCKVTIAFGGESEKC